MANGWVQFGFAEGVAVGLAVGFTTGNGGVLGADQADGALVEAMSGASVALGIGTGDSENALVAVAVLDEGTVASCLVLPKTDMTRSNPTTEMPSNATAPIPISAIGGNGFL